MYDSIAKLNEHLYEQQDGKGLAFLDELMKETIAEIESELERCRSNLLSIKETAADQIKLSLGGQ